jgi:hypothetical protein
MRVVSCQTAYMHRNAHDRRKIQVGVDAAPRPTRSSRASYILVYTHSWPNTHRVPLAADVPKCGLVLDPLYRNSSSVLCAYLHVFITSHLLGPWFVRHLCAVCVVVRQGCGLWGVVAERKRRSGRPPRGPWVHDVSCLPLVSIDYRDREKMPRHSGCAFLREGLIPWAPYAMPQTQTYAIAGTIASICF